MIEGDYVVLSSPPMVPPNDVPSSQECERYEFITMKQLCDIAVYIGIGRSRACNAFGGDKGKYHNILLERKARIYSNKKYVLSSAVIEYFRELGIKW